MRDPNRIPRVLAKLKLLWHNNPDLRLGQLLLNINAYATGGSLDAFNTEDDKMEEVIDNLLKNGW
jgi:uncharacterized protein YihD (DUF1040 family)